MALIDSEGHTGIDFGLQSNSARSSPFTFPSASQGTLSLFSRQVKPVHPSRSGEAALALTLFSGIGSVPGIRIPIAHR